MSEQLCTKGLQKTPSVSEAFWMEMFMIRQVSNLYGYTIRAEDGDIGRVHDFYFDDEDWIIRYLVADTSAWFQGKKVLIATSALDKPDWDAGDFPVHLTREQVENSPGIDEDKPVSRQYQEVLHDYYGWDPYWRTSAQAEAIREVVLEGIEGDPHLRSTRTVTDYVIAANDGAAGYLEDFVIEDVGWKVQYLMVDESKWLPGRKTLILPLWVKEFNLVHSQISVDLTQESLRESPACDPSNPVTSAYLRALQDYYRRMKKWEGSLDA